MNIAEWRSSVGIYKDPFIDSELIDPSVYVRRTNASLLQEVITSTENRESQIMLITGPWGWGKGAFKRTFQTSLDSAEDVLINTFTVVQPNFTELQFYKAVGHELGLNFGRYWRDRLGVRRMLTDKIHTCSEKEFLLLIIDDAHYLTAEALHAVKYITDIEREGIKCCTALLLGTKRVLNTLARGSLGQVVDRIHLRRSLKPFSQRDTLEYIVRALAYGNECPLSKEYEFPYTPKGTEAESKRLGPFSKLAGIRIYGLTGGVPRYVRLLCSEAIKVRVKTLDKSPDSEKFSITPVIVQQAWDSLLQRNEVRS